MQKINTSAEDEKTIRWILSELEALTQPSAAGYLSRSNQAAKQEAGQGGESRIPKLYALRIALALSLKEGSIPDLASPLQSRGAEYSLQQVTGMGRGLDSDLTETLQALLSVRHSEDLFGKPPAEDPEKLDRDFVALLYAHIHRGLRVLSRAQEEQRPLLSFLLEALFEQQVQNRMGTRLLARLRQRQVSVEAKEEVRGGCSQAVRLRCLSEHDLKRVETFCDELAFDLGWPPETTFVVPETDARHLWIETALPFAQWNSTGVPDIDRWLKREQRDDARLLAAFRGEKAPLTVSIDRWPVHWIVGDSESGKTNLLRVLLLQWRSLHGPQSDVHIFDQESTSEWLKLKRFECVSVWTVDELSAAANSLFPWWKNITSGEKPRLLLIDNAEAVFASIPAFGQRLLELLKHPLSGLTCLLASDAPFAVEQLRQSWLKEHLGSKMVLRVPSSELSTQLLGFTGAERLQGHGDVLVQTKDYSLRGRAPNVTWEQLRLKWSGQN